MYVKSYKLYFTWCNLQTKIKSLKYAGVKFNKKHTLSHTHTPEQSTNPSKALDLSSEILYRVEQRVSKYCSQKASEKSLDLLACFLKYEIWSVMNQEADFRYVRFLLMATLLNTADKFSLTKICTYTYGRIKIWVAQHVRCAEHLCNSLGRLSLIETQSQLVRCTRRLSRVFISRALCKDDWITTKQQTKTGNPWKSRRENTKEHAPSSGWQLNMMC